MVEKIRAICKAKGIPVSRLEKDLGYANGYLNPKKAETLRLDRVAEIAQYLGISLTEIDDNSPENRTVEMLQSLRDEDRALLQVARNMTPAEVQAAVDFLRRLKGGSDNAD